MARNEFSFDGVDAGVVFIDGSDDGSVEHHLKAGDGALALGSPWTRQGIVEGELDDFAVTVNSARVVTIAPGLCFVEHTDGRKYAVVNRANKTLTLGAPGSAARTDAITMQVDTATITATLAAVAGPDIGGNPDIPANSLVLANVVVPPSGDPTVSLPTTRFAALRTAAQAAGLGKTEYQALLQRPADFHTVEFYNDRGYTRNPTRKWLLSLTNELHEYKDTPYGWVRDYSVAARTFGAGHAGKPLLPYWDAANGNLWAIKGNQGHIVESTTPSRVTTGSASITISLTETGSTLQLSHFGDRRGVGVQSGTNYYVVGNPNGGGRVAIGLATIIGQAQSATVVLTQGSSGSVALHSANVTAPLQFAAPGDNGSVLAAFHTNGNVDFHAAAANGKVEQWAGDGTKDATTAELPQGNLFGREFDPHNSIARDYLGPTPNTAQTSGGVGPTLARFNTWLSGNPQSADWLAAYDADPNALFEFNGAGLFIYVRRQGGAWVQVGGVFNTQTRRTLPTTPGDAGIGWSGIYTVMRFDSTLCWASNELIIPVLNPDAQTEFWPYG